MIVLVSGVQEHDASVWDMRSGAAAHCMRTLQWHGTATDSITRCGGWLQSSDPAMETRPAGG